MGRYVQGGDIIKWVSRLPNDEVVLVYDISMKQVNPDGAGAGRPGRDSWRSSRLPRVREDADGFRHQTESQTGRSQAAQVRGTQNYFKHRRPRARARLLRAPYQNQFGRRALVARNRKQKTNEIGALLKNVFLSSVYKVK